MRIIKSISPVKNFDLFFNELLQYLNTNRHVSHVTLKSEIEFYDKTKEAQWLSILANKVFEYLQYAITPPPTVDFSLTPTVLIESEEEKLWIAQIEDLIGSPEMVATGAPEEFIASIDFDGCADTPEGQQHIVHDIVQYVAQNPSIKQVVVVIGSLRQSLACDYYNAIRNAPNHEGKLLSCHQLGTHFIEKLRTALFECEHISESPTVTFDSLMMSDILNYFELGTTYKALNKFHEKLQRFENPQQFVVKSRDERLVDLLCFSQHSKVVHSFEWNDASKLSTLLTQMHHFVNQGSKARHFRFYDDRQDILETLHYSFSRHNLIPSTILYDCVQMNEEGLKVLFPPIIGVEEPIENYSAMLFHLAKSLSDHADPSTYLAAFMASYAEGKLQILDASEPDSPCEERLTPKEESTAKQPEAVISDVMPPTLVCPIARRPPVGHFFKPEKTIATVGSAFRTLTINSAT